MSGAATTCPSCNKPLPAAVVSGPAQAVVRCEGCQTLLLWSNGRVMRSAKSSTGTMMGMPAVKVPATPGGKESEAPLPELKPEADSVPVTAKSSFPKPPPAKTPPPRGATQPLTKVPQKAPGVTGLADNVPTRVVVPSPELRKESARKDPTPAPMKVPPSGPVKLPPAAPAAPAAAKPAAPAAKPAAPAPAARPSAPAAKPAAPATKTTQPTNPVAAPTEPEAPHVVAAVAQVPQMPSSGDMVDPSAWFAGDVSDVVPPEKLPAIETSRPARAAEPTGAAPLPPPPTIGILDAEPLEIEPFGEEKTPAVGLSMGDLSGPIPIAKSDEPSLQIAVAPPRPAREPSQKLSTLPPAAPSAPAPREPSQKIATLPPAPAAAPGVKKSASSIRGADPLVPAAVGAGPSTDLPAARTQIGKAPEAVPSSRATIMGRPAMELPKAAEQKPAEQKPAEQKASDPIAAAVTMLPSPSPAPKPEPRMEPLRPERADPTPPRAHVAVNVPEPVTMKEPSAEALPPPPVTPEPPPMMALEATSQTTLPVTSRVPRAVPRRLLFIVGGAAVGVIALVFMVLALSHGGTPATSKPRPTPTPAPVAAATKPEPSAPAAPTTAAPTTAKPEPATPEPSAPPTAPVATPEPSGAAAAPATPSPPRPRHTLGGKKVVLEYDPKPTSPAPPSATAPTPMGEDPATVARAREAYHKGNVKLFAGDTAGAIALYRESLKIYPGYVAGYRGLGLGYEAAGNKDEALKAFHTYVRTVPSAADTTIIRRRIEHLESAPAKP